MKDVTKPAPPPNRVELTGFGSLWFASQAECDEYLAEPLWRRLLGVTKYQHRLRKASTKDQPQPTKEPERLPFGVVRTPQPWPTSRT
jgi:hypothetical protein